MTDSTTQHLNSAHRHLVQALHQLDLALRDGTVTDRDHRARLAHERNSVLCALDGLRWVLGSDLDSSSR